MTGAGNQYTVPEYFKAAVRAVWPGTQSDMTREVVVDACRTEEAPSSEDFVAPLATAEPSI